MERNCTNCTKNPFLCEWSSYKEDICGGWESFKQNGITTAKVYKTAPKNATKEGKSRMSLLPMDVLRKYMIPAYEEGIIKYSRESWRAGFLVSEMVDAAFRHIEEFFYENEDIDPSSDTAKHHIAGGIFSLLCILQTLEKHPELDNRDKATGLDSLKERVERKI